MASLQRYMKWGLIPPLEELFPDSVRSKLFPGSTRVPIEKMDLFESLPNELITEMLSYLTPFSLSVVCSLFPAVSTVLGSKNVQEHYLRLHLKIVEESIVCTNTVLLSIAGHKPSEIKCFSCYLTDERWGMQRLWSKENQLVNESLFIFGKQLHDTASLSFLSSIPGPMGHPSLSIPLSALHRAKWSISSQWDEADYALPQRRIFSVPAYSSSLVPPNLYPSVKRSERFNSSYQGNSKIFSIFMHLLTDPTMINFAFHLLNRSIWPKKRSLPDWRCWNSKLWSFIDHWGSPTFKFAQAAVP